MTIKSSNLHNGVLVDIAEVFHKPVVEGNRLLSSGRVSEAAALFLMIEAEMKDFIRQQTTLLGEITSSQSINQLLDLGF